jgi:3-hydroxyisobutyrate dehydrogenase-like beta-hydroxyacid dehydrogenase
MANLGFIGLGDMGSRMVTRLLSAGHTVTGFNRTPSKAQSLIEAGMRWADSPRAVTQAADITFSMITNTEVLHAITGGPDGILAGLGPGKIFVEMSTVSPSAIRQLAEQVKEKGAEMCDAPVSGSILTLEQGRLTIMVGGQPETFAKIKPILLDIGPKVIHVGTNGLGSVLKIAINISIPVQFLAFSEGLLLAEKAGIDPEVAAEVMLNSAIASPALQYRGPFALKLPEVAWFNVNMQQKDAVLAEELGRQLNVTLPTLAVANQMLTAARAAGYEKEDFAVVHRVLARLAGLEK